LNYISTQPGRGTEHAPKKRRKRERKKQQRRKLAVHMRNITKKSLMNQKL